MSTRILMFRLEAGTLQTGKTATIPKLIMSPVRTDTRMATWVRLSTTALARAGYTRVSLLGSCTMTHGLSQWGIDIERYGMHSRLWMDSDK